MEKNFPQTSYLLLNHPSRALKYSPADIRDFNNAAPDVFLGFEGIPGHQKEAGRGGYGQATDSQTTYGGADIMVAKVGGLWDSLLGEGRNIWMFANSDFHATAGDFWPGEYSKNYTWISSKSDEKNENDDSQGKRSDKNSSQVGSSDYQALVDGLHSGNSFAVIGDLINALDFSIKSEGTATMGQTLVTKKGKDAQITISFKSPAANNNGDAVKVDHIDLISGDVTAKAVPGTPEYNNSTNSTTSVITRFTSKDWDYKNGWYTIKYTVKNISKNQYFRLRGTNMGLNVPNQTDENGNPLKDSLVGTNDPAQAYADLWFYSNPVFVNVR